MDSRNLDLADQFCKLVGKPHLLAYLGLTEDASPEAAKKKLKARRKYMQGMQSNPKYKNEAIFLIKNFSALTQVLDTPVQYLKDAKRRAESQHLPVLEMTIKGVLTGGSLTHEQEDYLRRNALELGVSDVTFEEVLDRLCRESNVDRASAALTITPEELKSVDFYHLLGVPRHASRDEIYARYRAKKEETANISDPRQRESTRTRVEKAWKVLSDPETRQRYDLSWTRTGPPARNRTVARPVQAATAPPIRLRDQDPSQPPPTGPSLAPARMEVLSERKQTIPIAGKPITISIEVRNGGELPLRGTVRSDVSWLKVLTTALKPEAKHQSVRVQLVPSLVDGRSDTGTVTLVSEGGQTADVEFTAVRKSPQYLMFAAGGAGLGLLVLAGIFLVFWLGASTEYVIEVDPWADEILLDQKLIGSRTDRVVLESPPLGEATIVVLHPNFGREARDIIIEPGGRVLIDLDLEAPMDFRPTSDMERGNLDLELVNAIKPRLDLCLRSGLTSTSGLSGVLRIHIGQNGIAQGLEAKGDVLDSPAIMDCLKRQAAGPIFPPIKDGDYATVLYEYNLSPSQ
jgi:hypothetical protein